MYPSSINLSIVSSSIRRLERHDRRGRKPCWQPYIALHSLKNERMTLFKIRSKTLHTTEVRLNERLLATSSGPPFLNIGHITAAFQGSCLPRAPRWRWPTTIVVATEIWFLPPSYAIKIVFKNCFFPRIWKPAHLLPAHYIKKYVQPGQFLPMAGSPHE